MKLVKALGNASFAVLEEATRKLMKMPGLDTDVLADAIHSSTDPEIRFRGQEILKARSKSRQPPRQRILFAALKTIEQRRYPGLTQELIATIPLCNKPYLVEAAHAALAATARPGDAVPLTKGAQSDNPHVRAACAKALGTTLGVKSTERLLALTKDEHQQVQLAAAESLANLGDRHAAGLLLRLMLSDDVAIRARSCAVLRSFTKQRFGFVAYDGRQPRAAALARWKEWLATDGKEAKLHFPPEQYSLLGGKTLLAYGNRDKVAKSMRPARRSGATPSTTHRPPRSWPTATCSSPR